MISVTVKGLPNELADHLQLRLRADIWDEMKHVKGISAKEENQVSIYLPYDYFELGGNETLTVEILGVQLIALRDQTTCDEITQAVCVAVQRFTEQHVRGCKHVSVYLVHTAALTEWDSVNGFSPEPVDR